MGKGKSGTGKCVSCASVGFRYFFQILHANLLRQTGDRSNLYISCKTGYNEQSPDKFYGRRSLLV